MKRIHILTIVCAVIFTAFYQNGTAQSAATYNMEVKDFRNNLILLGKSTRERLEQEPFGSWFKTNYKEYTIDTATANQLKPYLQNKRFLVFMGTWCGDSRREVPRIYKLLDYCGVSPSNIELVNVNNHDTAYKQSPTHEEKGLNIHRVPDLLIFENGKEIGRVVEFPVISWEKDLLQIFNNHSYIPNYKAVPFMDSLFRKHALRKLKKSIQRVAGQVKPLVQNRYELFSYAKVKMALQDTGSAIYLYQLNTLLFPGDPEVWNSLGAAYEQAGETGKAIEQYKKALQVQPGNEMATGRLQQLSGQ